MTDRDDALADIDSARADIAAVGLYRYGLTVRQRRWTGQRPGDGTAIPTDLAILPRPKVRVLSLREVAASGGTYREGDYWVTGITPAFGVLQIAVRKLVGPSAWNAGVFALSTSILPSGVIDQVSPVQVRCDIGGALGSVARFSYSLNAGSTWTAVPGTPSSFAVTSIGLVVGLSGTFGAGDIYSFTWASGGFTPLQIRPVVQPNSSGDVRYLIAGDERTFVCTLIEADFDKAFGLRLVLRSTRETP
jgi:hypothetical protein